MDARIHLYVNRKNPAVWLTVLCMLGSGLTRIFAFSGMDAGHAWSMTVIPAAAAVLYGVIVIGCGQEMFYKTAIPVWLLGASYAHVSFILLAEHPFLYAMTCVCILFFCAAYTGITGGRLRCIWLLLPLYLLALAALAYIHRQISLYITEGAEALRYVLPDYLMVLGMLVLLFALKVHTDGKYHPTWGDRADGRRLRSIPALDQVAPYIMVNRTGANNLFSESVEITELERYVRRKRKEGLTSFGVTHVILASYVRTIAKHPALNRFVAGQKVFSRGEDVVVCMTVKKEMSKSSPDTVVKVHLNPHDTAEDVYRKFNAAVTEAKNTMQDSGVDNAAGILTLIPGLVLKFVVWLLRTLDYFGLVPGFLLEISPFHGSAYFTSMGSLGIRPVYHHLYDFGTIPVFCSFGRKRHATEMVDGELIDRKYIDMKFNLDERICDGFYYASVIKYFMRTLSRPEVLEEAPAVVEKDIP